MTKEYTHVRLEIPVYDSLKIHADKDKKSISKYIENLLSQMLTTNQTSQKITIGQPLEEVANPVFRKELGGSSPPLVAFY